MIIVTTKWCCERMIVVQFLCKPEAVRTYLLPEQASWECFRAFCPLFPYNNFKIIIYIVIICDIIIINNDDARLQGPIFCSRFPWAHERISRRIIYNLGTPSHLWNIGLLKRDYTALYSRKLSSSAITVFTKTLPLVRVLRQVNPTHTLIFYFFSNYFNIILLSNPRFPN
jgi:hypothetical protein